MSRFANDRVVRSPVVRLCAGERSRKELSAVTHSATLLSHFHVGDWKGDCFSARPPRRRRLIVPVASSRVLPAFLTAAAAAAATGASGSAAAAKIAERRERKAAWCAMPPSLPRRRLPPRCSSHRRVRGRGTRLSHRSQSAKRTRLTPEMEQHGSDSERGSNSDVTTESNQYFRMEHNQIFRHVTRQRGQDRNGLGSGSAGPRAPAHLFG